MLKSALTTFIAIPTMPRVMVTLILSLFAILIADYFWPVEPPLSSIFFSLIIINAFMHAKTVKEHEQE